jgi:ribosomal-protein-serine acetyltransferase
MLRRELPNGYALRLLEESDADELFALIDANRAHLERWMPWVEHEHEPADVLPFIRGTRRQIADNDGMQTAIVAPDRRIVGMVGFHSIDWMNRKSSIGYWLARDEQGRGTMTEAVRAHVENARSRAIPERLGFREEGVLRQVERVGGRMLDGVVYAMLADDWPGRS